MNKKRVLVLFVEFIFVIVSIIVFVLINDQIKQNKMNKFKPVDDSLFYVYEVENATIEGSELVIKGWFFEVGKFRNIEHERQNNKKLGVMLYNIDLDDNKKGDLANGTKMSVSREKRNDVNAYFKCEYDYTDCGFIAKVDLSQIDIDNCNYQLIFKVDDSDYPGITSNTFLCCGHLEFVNPRERMKLVTIGTDLDTIVNEGGVCIASFPDKHICVYQYRWDLYWIAEKDYEFGDNDKTYMQFQIDTTQFDKLPQDRLESEQYWANLGEHFEKNEITDSFNCGNYRVSKREIPQDYSVTSILIGYNKSGDWKWMQYIKPRHMFS